MAVHRVLPMPTTAGLTPNDLQPGPTHDPDLMAPRVRDAPHVLGHVDAGASLRHPPRLSPSPTLSLSPPAGPARLAHGSRPAADVPPPPPTAAPALAHDSADVGILLKENDAIVETNRNLHAQNRRLIKEVAQQTANVTTAEEALNDVIEEVDDLKEEMAIVRNGYQSTEEELKAVKAMLSQAYIDLEMQQAELRSAREDIGDRDAQMAHLRQSLEQAMAQYTSHVRESAALADGQHHAKQALAQAVATIAEKNEAITLLQKETRVLSDEFDKLQALCARYHENQAGLEGQHAAIVKTNHELSEALAQARLTIEQNRLTEAGLVKQVETLQQRMQAVEASQQAHAADAQAAAKARFAKQQRLLSGQVRVLEDALSEANAAHARTIRDKQSLEAEMEQLAAAGPDEARRVEGAVAALEERLRHVERDRQHLEQRCHSTQQQLLFTEKQHTTERLALATKIQQLEQRTQRTQDDAARAHEQLLESTRHRGELEKALDGCRRKLAQDHAASQAQLAAATQQSDAKRDELQARLAAVEQARDRATQELMHVITQQKVVSERWRHDRQKSAQQAESFRAKATAERNAWAHRITELESRLAAQETYKAEAVSRRGIDAEMNAQIRIENNMLRARLAETTALLAREPAALRAPTPPTPTHPAAAAPHSGRSEPPPRTPRKMPPNEIEVATQALVDRVNMIKQRTARRADVAV